MSRQLTGTVVAVGAPQEKPDIRYRTGLSLPDPVVYVRHRGKDYVVVSVLDRELARREAGRMRIYIPDDLRIPGSKRGGRHGWIVGLLKKLSVRSVAVTNDFPVVVADNIRKAGFRLRAVGGSVAPEREIKTRAEIARITDCQRAAVHAMRAAIRLIVDSRPDRKNRLRLRGRLLTSEGIRKVINGVLAEHNCVCEGTIVSCGTLAAKPHFPGYGALRANESIVIDIFPRHLEHGYHGDLTRTVVKGAPSPELKKMRDAVKAAHAAVLEKIRAGASGHRLHCAASGLLEKRGFKTGILDGRAQGFIHSTGHGIGLDIHEAPSIGTGAGRLRAGNVVTVEPGLYYFPQGGVRIEDTVLVTKRGYRKLASCPYVFRV